MAEAESKLKSSWVSITNKEETMQENLEYLVNNIFRKLPEGASSEEELKRRA